MTKMNRFGAWPSRPLQKLNEGFQLPKVERIMNRWYWLWIPCIFLFHVGNAWADGAWVSEIKDTRGRIVSAVPQKNTSISMQNERVVLIPYYDASVAKHPLVFVNVSYLFSNPNVATTLPIGFPELRQRVVKQSNEGHMDPEHLTSQPCGTKGSDDEASFNVTCPETIQRFFAHMEGQMLPVRVRNGSG